MSATTTMPSAVPGIDHSLVESLAREYHRSEQDVEGILHEEYGRLAAQARINTYLVVLATSNTRIRLRSDPVTAC